jgi:cytochrome P450
VSIWEVIPSDILCTCRHGGKVNHETIEEMEYLEATIMENLRIHPPILSSQRYCAKDCEAGNEYLLVMKRT